VRVEAAYRYAGIFEAITGERFEPDWQEPMQRMRKNLGL